MGTEIRIADAFAAQRYEGNPLAVVLDAALCPSFAASYCESQEASQTTCLE